jgi:ketosteroid isomerase-like protein
VALTPGAPLVTPRFLEGTTVLDPPDLTAIKQLEQRWLACELDGRASDVLELCSADIVWLPPGRPPLRGKAAIREWLASLRDRIEDIDIDHVAIDGHAFGAYKLATFRTRHVPCRSTEAVMVTGWHLWLLQPDADFRWRVSLVVWGLVES